MNDKKALEKIVFMVHDYVNQADYISPTELVSDLVEFLEENVIHSVCNGVLDTPVSDSTSYIIAF